MKILCAAIVALLFSAALGLAKPVGIPGENATVDIPDTWTVKATPAAAAATPTPILTATSPDNNTALVVLVTENTEGVQADNQGFMDNVKQGITGTANSSKAALQFQPDATLSLGGVPASCIKYTETPSGGKTVNCRVYDVGANGKMYTFSLQTLDPAQDAALVAMANSLAFSSPPTLPSPHSDELAAKYGQIVGAFIGVLAAIVTIRWIARRKKA